MVFIDNLDKCIYVAIPAMLSLMLITMSRDKKYSSGCHGAESLDVDPTNLFHRLCKGLLHVLGHTGHIPSSGMLHLLFPPPGIFFHWMSVELALSLPSILCSNVTSSVGPFLTILFKVVAPHISHDLLLFPAFSFSKFLSFFF